MERYRIHPEAAVYFLTYSVVEWLPIFVNEKSCRVITESLTFCNRQNWGRWVSDMVLLLAVRKCGQGLLPGGV
jgi:hypothetical protein